MDVATALAHVGSPGSQACSTLPMCPQPEQRLTGAPLPRFSVSLPVSPPLALWSGVWISGARDLDAVPLGWVHITVSDPPFVFSPELRAAIIAVTRDSWDPVQDDAPSRVDSLSDDSSEDSQVLSIDSTSEDELDL